MWIYKWVIDSLAVNKRINEKMIMWLCICTPFFINMETAWLLVSVFLVSKNINVNQHLLRLFIIDDGCSVITYLGVART